MAKTMLDEIPSLLITERDHTVREAGVHNDDEETWAYRNDQSKNEEILDGTAAPTIDEITTQGIDTREKPMASFIVDADDSDDDDDIQVTIGNYEPEVSTFQTNRQKNRQMLPTNPMMAPKPSTVRGVDFDAQGMINGQPTYDHDIANAYKDEEKPWKKPGADITDYFNYGFTEETWAQYSDRQRRLRAENNLARLNIGHPPPMQNMMPNHPPMGHPMMMVNKPMNMAMMQRPMNFRKPDGKIGVIGTTDQTSRRIMFEPPNNFEHAQFINGPPFAGGQPQNVQTVGDLISTPPNANGHPSTHGTPPNGSHHIQTLGANRLPLISIPSGMQFRPQFGHPQVLGGPQFFPRGPMAGMHGGDRPPQPYFVPRHPQQPWDKTAPTSLHGFPLGSFQLQMPVPTANNDGRGPSSRSATPENHSSRSATPEENRANTNATSGENDKSSKDDRYKERYRDDRDHHSSSHRSSSSSYRPHHRSSEHEYERPRNDRKSSRDRDDKYDRYSRKRNHRDDSDRHHSSHRTPTKTNATPSELSQTSNDQPEPISEPGPSSPVNRSHRDDSERSSSRHSHHKKSSKRSRHDSGDERSGSHHHHRRSSDKSNHSNKKSTDSLSDTKDQINE